MKNINYTITEIINKLTVQFNSKTDWRHEDIDCVAWVLNEFNIELDTYIDMLNDYLDITGTMLSDDEYFDIVMVSYEFLAVAITEELDTDVSDSSELFDIESGGFTHARITPTELFDTICAEMGSDMLKEFPRARKMYLITNS